jgi:hypothetical protein
LKSVWHRFSMARDWMVAELDGQTADISEHARIRVRSSADVTQFALRRVVFQRRPNMLFTLLSYCTGTIAERPPPPCPEGTLAWVTARELPEMALVGSSRLVLPLLVAHCERDPACLEPLRPGLASFGRGGEFDRIAWTDAD